MKFPDFVGNGRLKDRLGESFDIRGLFHAHVISGPPGSGRRTLARIIAAASICSGSGDPPCGTCAACVKTFSGIHPDIFILTPPDGKKDVSVDQIRSLRREVSILPNEADVRVFILPEADKLHFSAQNALLKVLEEPPDYALFLLLVENPALLLETIRSRCIELVVSPISEDEAVEFLMKRYPDLPHARAEEAARLCGGVLGKAVLFLEDQAGEAEELVSGFLTALNSRDRFEMMTFAVSLEKRDRLVLSQLFLRSRETFSRFLTELKKTGAAPFNAGELDRLIKMCDLLYDYSQYNVGQGHLAGCLSCLCDELICE